MDLLCAENIHESRAIKDSVIFDDSRVLNELLEMENFYIPFCDYFRDVQIGVDPFVRRIVTKWMLEVCEELNCEDQVFPLAVNLFDRYLCGCETPTKFWQLLSADCILIASKIRQSVTIPIETLCYYTNHSVTPCQMKQYELLLVSKLNWDLSSITAFDFIDHILHRVRWNKHEKMIRRHAFTLVHLCYTEIEFMRMKPSAIATACVVAAVRGIKLKIDINTLSQLCSLTRMNFIDVENSVDIIEKIIASETSAVIKTSKSIKSNNHSSEYEVQLTSTERYISTAMDEDKPISPMAVHGIQF